MEEITAYENFVADDDKEIVELLVFIFIMKDTKS